MAKRLYTAKPTPRSVASGQAVTVTITFSADAQSTGSVVAPPGFSVSPESFTVPGEQYSTAKFELAITRTTSMAKECRLALGLFQDEVTCRVVVT